jgi:hypothetical protein
MIENDREARNDLKQRVLIHDRVRVPVARGVRGPLYWYVRP